MQRLILVTVLSSFFHVFTSAAPAVCTSGIYGSLASFAPYDAIQIDCQRAFPRPGATTTVTNSQTSTTTTATTTITANTRIITDTATSTAPTSTITSRASTTTTVTVVVAPTTITTGETQTVTDPSTRTTTQTSTTSTVTETITTAGPDTVTRTETFTSTFTSEGVVRKRDVSMRRDNRDALIRREALPNPQGAVKSPSKEEAFFSTLSAQGASSSSVFKTFCSCYATGVTATVRPTTSVRATRTTTPSTTTFSTTTVTPVATSTTTTTTTATSTTQLSFTVAPTTIITITTTATSTTTTTTTSYTTNTVTTTTTTSITVKPSICSAQNFPNRSEQVNRRCGCYYEFQCGSIVGGAELGSPGYDSATDCAGYCDVFDTCATFRYDPVDKRCYITQNPSISAPDNTPGHIEPGNQFVGRRDGRTCSNPYCSHG